MYNRYVPTADGSYQRKIMHSAKNAPTAPPQRESPPKEANVVSPTNHILPSTVKLEAEDLLVVLILALVLLCGQDTEHLPMLLTIAAFLLMH